MPGGRPSAQRLAQKAEAQGAAGDDSAESEEMLMSRQPARPGQEPHGVLDARRAVGELSRRPG
jgi:hypothetical protein